MSDAPSSTPAATASATATASSATARAPDVPALASGGGSGSGSATATAGAGGSGSSSARAASTTPCVCPGHSRSIVGIHYSPPTPDGVFFISACHDKLPMLRDGETGDWIGTFEGHKGAVWSAKLNPEATRAATGSADFTARVWDSISGDELYNFEHSHIVKSVDFSADGTRLVTGGHDKKVRIFDLSKPESDPILFSNEEQKISKVLWTDGGKSILVGSDDSKLRLWDLASGKVVKTIDLTGRVMDLEASRDGKRLIAAAGHQVTILNAETYDLEVAHTLDIEVETASLHPTDPTRFVAGGEDMCVRLLDTNTGEEIITHKGHHGPVHCIRWAPGGNAYSSGSGDGTIRIWPYAARS